MTNRDDIIISITKYNIVTYNFFSFSLRMRYTYVPHIHHLSKQTLLYLKEGSFWHGDTIRSKRWQKFPTVDFFEDFNSSLVFF